MIVNTRALVTIAFLLIAAPQVPCARRLYIRRHACSIVASNGSKPAAKSRNGGTCAPVLRQNRRGAPVDHYREVFGVARSADHDGWQAWLSDGRAFGTCVLHS